MRTDAIVATVLLCMILLLAIVLFSQFRFRMKTERTLRKSEAHYRLLANNIADVIILIDARSLLRYVSQSVEPVLGLRPEDLLGKSCFDMIHPEDRESVRSATQRLSRNRYGQHRRVSNLARRRNAGLGRKQVQAGRSTRRPRTDGVPLRHPRRHRTQADGGRVDPAQPPPHPARRNRRTDRTDQPAHLRRLPAAPIRSLRRDCGAAVRYRQFQGLQRHLRTSGRRSLPAGGRESRSGTRPPIRRACPRVMAARNSPSCCRTRRKTPP